MSEVSCRAFSYFLTAERHGLLDLDALLAGLPVERAYLSDPRNRVSWELWARLCDRTVEQMGHDPQLIRRASELVTETGSQGFAGYIRPIASLFGSVEDMYHVVAKWGGPSLYRSHTFTCERLVGGQLRLEIALKPGFRSCRAWFAMIPSALQVVPRFAGQPDAGINVERLDDRSASFLITPPPSRTLRAQLARLWTAVRAPSALIDELAFQQQQLGATLDTLRQTEGGFRAALDALPAFVLLHNGQTVIYANPAVCIATERALVGQPIHELVAIDERARFDAILAGNADADAAPLRLLRGDGSLIHIEVGILPEFEFGGRQARGVFAVDVSRRVQSEATTRLLSDMLPDLLIHAAGDGTVLDIHAGSSLKSHAVALQMLIGRRGFDLDSHVPGVVGEHIQRCRTAFEMALATGEEQQLEIDADLDRNRRFEVRLIPQANRREVLILVRDITIQRETEHRLAISERMASVGTLAAGVAHEINNPLTYVLGGLDDLAHQLTQLAARGTDVTGLRERLAEVSDGAGRVRDIVAALRVYSRVDTKTAIERVALSHVVERALAMCGSQLRQGARVVSRITSAPHVFGDSSQLIQVVVNLLLNAIQALSATERADARIEVRVETDSRGWAVITIDDNGPGIPSDLQAHVFDPFFTTKPRGQGTGLGLSISQRIVSEHGGELRLDSEPGRGCRFTIALPPSPEPVKAVERVPPPSAPVGATILVVDDEPLIAQTFARSLTAKGYTVRATSSPHDALTLLETASYDLIICDLMMPEMTGMELFARIEQARPELAARFMFATGGAFSEEARSLLERTSQPTLDKPFSSETLSRAVIAALGRFDKSPPRGS